MNVESYQSSDEAANALIESLITQINISAEKYFSIAVSGGNNPIVLFHVWAEKYRNLFPWKRIRIYWVDERCVPPTNMDSNYFMAKINLLDKVPLQEHQIYRIHGEENAEEEAIRYTTLVCKNLSERKGLPVFDYVLLGIGPDGHTSSVFPKQEYLYDIDKPYLKNIHPNTKQTRIAMMPQTILNARHIAFFATGTEKRKILESVIAEDEHLPAGFIAHHAPSAVLYTA